MADPAEAVAADHIVVLKGVAAEQMAELGMEVITPKVGPAKGPQQEHGRLPPVHCIQEEVAEEGHIMKVTAITNARLEATVDPV